MFFLFFLLSIVAIGVGVFLIWYGMPKTRNAYERQYGDKQDAPADRSRILSGIGSIVLGVFLLLFGTGWVEIPAGEVGVITSFGQIHQETLGPGLHWQVPVVNNTTLMDSRVQTYEFKDISGASSDLQEVTLSGLVTFHLDPAHAQEIYQTVGVDYKDKVFTRPSDTILKSVTPKFKAQDIVGQRVQIGDQTREQLQTAVEPYGIVVDSVNISNIGLSADFLQAIEDKVKAEQEAQKQRTLVQVSQAQADQARAVAQGQADAAVIAAQGQADANTLLNNSLTPALIEWQRIQKLNPNVQVIYLPSDGQFILPLPSTTPVAP